jgi:Flp pilus assembly protein TadG
MDTRPSYYRHSSRPSRRTAGRRRTRGQSLVEFALVLPLFLLILCGIMDFGFLLYSRMTVINAAREGARVATTMTEDAAQIPGAVQSQVAATANGLAVSTDVCRVPQGGGGCAGFGGTEPGDSVRVTVNYSHHAFFPLIFGTAIPMSSTVQMVLE